MYSIYQDGDKLLWPNFNLVNIEGPSLYFHSIITGVLSCRRRLINDYISPVDCGDCGDADSLGGGRSQGRRRHHVSHAVTSQSHTSHQGDTQPVSSIFPVFKRLQCRIEMCHVEGFERTLVLVAVMSGLLSAVLGNSYLIL